MTHIVVLSGGLDSTVALAHALLEEGSDVRAVTFDYNQTHTVELEAARRVAVHYSVPHRLIPIPGVLHGSALTGERPVPRVGYDEESMSDTVVHGRNLLFTSLAIAASTPGGAVTLGVHGGDHHLYPDCRPEFWEDLSHLARAAYGTRLHVPFLHWSKADIIAHGQDLQVPLDLTYSCYVGGSLHCGQCGTCSERRESFRRAGVSDPTTYVEDAARV